MSATLTKVKYAKLLGGGVKMFKLSKAKSGKAATPMAVSFVPINIQSKKQTLYFVDQKFIKLPKEIVF